MAPCHLPMLWQFEADVLEWCDGYAVVDDRQPRLVVFRPTRYTLIITRVAFATAIEKDSFFSPTRLTSPAQRVAHGWATEMRTCAEMGVDRPAVQRAALDWVRHSGWIAASSLIKQSCCKSECLRHTPLPHGFCDPCGKATAVAVRQLTFTGCDRSLILLNSLAFPQTRFSVLTFSNLPRLDQGPMMPFCMKSTAAVRHPSPLQPSVL